MKTKNIFSLFFVASIFVSYHMANAATSCENIFRDETWSYHEQDQSYLEHKDVLDVLSQLANQKSIDHFISYGEAKAILADKDLPLYGTILTQVVKNMSAKQVSADNFSQALHEVLLEHGYTDAVIQPRLADIRKAGDKNWVSILGDLSLLEVRQMFFGQDINNPSANSLVGQYLAATGASAKLISFPKVLGGTELGPQRLVVSVDETTFPTFQKLILSSSHYMTVVGHANVIHKSMFYGFGGGKSDIRMPSVGTPFPILLFKTTEAQRLNRYMELTAEASHHGWATGLKQPWKLDNYCAAGGYSCCTHWIGNVPIGDKMVKEYKFPPRVENGNLTPQAKELTDYGNRPEWDALKKVWKVPGHEQLADVIGQQQANLVGEMASPGWVIQTLTGPTTAERVPIVFIIAQDHKAAIPDAPVLNFERPW